MANHKSALKRARQSEIRRLRNKHYKTRAKNAAKQVRLAVSGASAEPAGDSLPKAISILQKAASKGAIHKNTAARKISRLTRLFNQPSQS